MRTRACCSCRTAVATARHDWTPPGGVIDEGETPPRRPHPRGGGGDGTAGHGVGRAGLRGALRGARPRLAAAGRGARRGGLRGGPPRRRPRRHRGRRAVRPRRRLRRRTSTAATRGCACPWPSGWPSDGPTTRPGPTASRSPVARRRHRRCVEPRQRGDRHSAGCARHPAESWHAGLERGDVVGEAGGHLEGELGVAEVRVGPGLRQPLPAVAVGDERGGLGLGPEDLAPPLLLRGDSAASAASLRAGSGCSAWKPTSMASTSAPATCLAPTTWAS